MPRCPFCRERLPDEPERLGARCPRCREALYERPGAIRHRVDGQCILHASSPAVDACQRCGNFYCEVCRTRWHGQVLCLACIERAFETREADPAEARAHYQQALWSFICGLGSWALGLVGFVLMIVGFRLGPDSPGVIAIVPGVLLLMVGPLFALPGVGLGLSAIRRRGDHLILATAGLILSCLQVGTIIGYFSLSAWRN
jgi:hypothetical protein